MTRNVNVAFLIPVSFTLVQENMKYYSLDWYEFLWNQDILRTAVEKFNHDNQPFG